jgi:hypothetical protein
VNPENAPFCPSDVDMTLGHVSNSKVDISQDEMRMVLDLGDDTIIYIWKRIQH